MITTPGDQVLEATGPGGAALTYSASATDAVDGTDSVSCSPDSGSTFPLGTTTVNCSSTDSAGNMGHASFKVTVGDKTPPDLTVPADFSVEATGPAGATVTYSASATDLVDPSPTVSCSPASGTTFFIRVTPVTCTATDATGNSSSKTFRVTVKDTTAPALKVPGRHLGRDQRFVRGRHLLGVGDGHRRSIPVRDLQPRLGLDLRARDDEGDLHGEGRSGNSTSKSLNVSVTQAQAPVTPPAPPPGPPPPPPPPPITPPGDVNAKPVTGKGNAKVKLPGSNTYVSVDQAKNLRPARQVRLGDGARHGPMGSNAEAVAVARSLSWALCSGRRLVPASGSAASSAPTTFV